MLETPWPKLGLLIFLLVGIGVLIFGGVQKLRDREVGWRWSSAVSHRNGRDPLAQRERQLCICSRRNVAGFRDSIRPDFCDLAALNHSCPRSPALKFTGEHDSGFPLRWRFDGTAAIRTNGWRMVDHRAASAE